MLLRITSLRLLKTAVTSYLTGFTWRFVFTVWDTVACIIKNQERFVLIQIEYS